MRDDRYGDWAGRDDDGRRPFFTGTAITERMTRLRQAIHEIRSGWESYPAFMADLQGVLAAGVEDEAALLFGSRKDWGAPADGDDFSALRLYTSDSGYRRIFATINAALRGGAGSGDDQAIRAAAFLIELLTIDLFHYRAREREADGFEGLVYRGMCVGGDDLARFHRLAAAPIADRHLSIPLALMSASTDSAQALEFALRETAGRPGTYPVLWRIRVAGLDAASMRLYQERFPSIVVTSICAVPIHRVSDYPQEREVLLRGPFFQILRIVVDRRHGGAQPLRIIDAVMLNSNRDHISTVASDEGDDRAARDLFRILVNLERARVCAGQVAGFSTAEARRYRELGRDWEKQLG